MAMYAVCSTEKRRQQTCNCARQSAHRQHNCHRACRGKLPRAQQPVSLAHFAATWHLIPHRRKGIRQARDSGLELLCFGANLAVCLLRLGLNFVKPSIHRLRQAPAALVLMSLAIAIHEKTVCGICTAGYALARQSATRNKWQCTDSKGKCWERRSGTAISACLCATCNRMHRHPHRQFEVRVCREVKAAHLMLGHLCQHHHPVRKKYSR